jgi:hypothetical protein
METLVLSVELRGRKAKDPADDIREKMDDVQDSISLAKRAARLK